MRLSKIAIAFTMNRRVYLVIALLIISNNVLSQTFKIDLSPKHSQKLSTIQSGQERLLKFYKFISFIKKTVQSIVKNRKGIIKTFWTAPFGRRRGRTKFKDGLLAKEW
jgi:hypothetical protein